MPWGALRRIGLDVVPRPEHTFPFGAANSRKERHSPAGCPVSAGPLLRRARLCRETACELLDRGPFMHLTTPTQKGMPPGGCWSCSCRIATSTDIDHQRHHTAVRPTHVTRDPVAACTRQASTP